METPKQYEFYSYYKTGELYVVLSSGYCKTMGYMVTLKSVTCVNDEPIVVPLSDFELEVDESFGECTPGQRYKYSKVDLSSFSHVPKLMLDSYHSTELARELNSRVESTYCLDRSSIVDHYYDLGVEGVDEDRQFMKLKEAQSRNQMLELYQSMQMLKDQGGREPLVRHHIIVNVWDPEEETPI